MGKKSGHTDDENLNCIKAYRKACMNCIAGADQRLVVYIGK